MKRALLILALALVVVAPLMAAQPDTTKIKKQGKHASDIARLMKEVDVLSKVIKYVPGHDSLVGWYQPANGGAWVWIAIELTSQQRTQIKDKGEAKSDTLEAKADSLKDPPK